MTNLSLGPVLRRTFSDPHMSFQVVLNKPVYNCGKQRARYLCIPSTYLWKHQLRKVLNDDFQTFPAGSAVKNLPANIGDAASVLGWEDPLEKETPVHSSILAWQIPWTEEPDGLQSMESEKGWTRLSD